MARILVARDARGLIVDRVQAALQKERLYTGRLDGLYGGGTQRAVSFFQEQSGLPATGKVDDLTWTPLVQSDPPTMFERCLQLTAALEGHGFGLVVGNFDGAGLTWGIIGFTLKHGEIPRIVDETTARDPGAITRAFGDLADELLRVMRAPA